MERSKECMFLMSAMVFALMTVLVVPTSAQTIGMVVGQSGGVTVFDADRDVVLGKTSIPGFPFIGDCSITADRSKGFVTRFDFNVYVIDLTTPTSPAPAMQPNPIPISNYGEDSSITPDEKFVAVCDGGFNQPVSVIDIATQTEVNTFSLGHSCNSVDVCSDGSVLVTSATTGTVRRLTIDGTGTLKDSGESLLVGSPNNAVCSPDAASGVVITSGSRSIHSFTIPGLSLVDTRTLSGSSDAFGLSAEISPTVDRIYTRSTGRSPASGTGTLDAFGYNWAGSITPTPIFTNAISPAPTRFGMDQMALHPDGSKMYVSNQSGTLEVYDAAFGNLLTTMDAPEGATGVCLSGGVAADTTPPRIDSLGPSLGTLWPPNQRMVPITISATVVDDTDPDPSVSITSVSSNEPINGRGNRNTGPDWEITGPLSVSLRSERAGAGSGRVYTIEVTATDAHGNTSTETTTVSVPHDRGRR